MSSKNTVQSILRPFGLQLVRTAPRGEVTDRVLARMNALGFQPSAILDVGASDGRWTISVLPLFPEAQYLLVEPRDECLPALKALSERQANVRFHQALLGESTRQVWFNVHSFQSSIYGNVRGEDFGDTMDLPMTTIDQVLEQVNFPVPQFIKLDIQGAELQALKGAKTTLKSVECVLTEVSFIPFQKDIPLAHQVIEFMAQHGFRIYDIYEMARRSFDGALIQAMLVFLSARSPLIADTHWGGDVPWS